MPILVGHRGAPRERTENTLGSLLRAVELGADAVEFDVRGTVDGKPILLHDRTLSRFWGDEREPGQVTAAEIRRLRHADGTGETVPTLAEVAEAVPVRLVVDGKDPALVPAVLDVLRSRDALARSCFIGEPPVLAVVRQLLPDAEIIMSWAKPELPGPELLATVRPQALNLRWQGLTDQTYAAIDELGYRMWTYCIDEPADAQRAVGLGVQALISNDLPAVVPALQRAGQEVRR